MKTLQTNSNRRLTGLQFIIFIICLLIAATSDAQSEWRTLSPFPSPENINDVQFIDDNTVVAVGFEGLFMISKDGGVNWDRFDLPSVSPIGKVLGLQVAFADANNGYASFGGGVFKTNSGGEAWTRVGEGILLSGSNNGTRAEEMQLLDINTVFIVQPNKAHKTVDGGTNWTEITPPGLSNLSGIHFLDANNGYIVSDFDGLYVTADGGANWTEVTSFVDGMGNTITRGTKIQFLDANTGWVLLNTNVSNSNGIAVTTDGGTTWARYTISGGLFSAKDMLFTSATNGRILDNNKILTTTDGGQTWTQEAILLSTYNQFSLNTSGNRMIMGGGSGALQWYDPVGVNTQLNNSITTGNIRDVLFLDDDNGFILDSDQLLRTSNGGVSWFSIDLDNYFDIHFPTSTVGYAIGNSGDVQKTTNGGFTWSLVGNVGSPLVNKCFFIDANTGWAIGQLSLIYVTTDGGATWTQQTAPVSDVSLFDIQFVDTNIGYAGGANGNLFKTIDGGSTWLESNFNESHFVNEIHFLDANTGWIATGNRVWYTTDGGDNWTVGAFPFHAGINAVEFLDANTGFAASGGGRVFKTTDGGLNWTFEVDEVTSSSFFELEVLDVDNMWAASNTVVARKSGTSTASSIGLFIPDDEFCFNDEIVVTFIANGDFNEDNVVSLQMSDEFGSFSNPDLLATLETDYGTGSILATIPDDAELSANYRFRVVSSDPMIVGDDNGRNVQIGVPIAPSSFITSSDQICENTNTVAYEVPEIEGVSYNWNYSGTGATITGSTHSITINFANNATGGTLTVNMENDCGQSENLELAITVDERTVGGSAIGGVDVCAGTEASQLSVTGHIGSVLRWEKAVSPFSTYEEIPGSASITFDPGTISETTRFRAIIQNGACVVLESSFTTVDIADPSEGGTVFAQNGITEIVAGASPGNLINTGRTGSIVRWEEAVAPFTTYTPISSTSGIYNPGALDVTTRFRAVVQNSNCDEDPSEFLEITVLDQTAPQAVSFSPVDENEEQPIDRDLTIEFDENIQSTGESSLVEVLNQANDVVLATVQLNDPSVADFNGTMLTMTLSADLPYETQVYVTIPGNGIEDLSGNAYAGFSDNETWDFGTAPEPDVTAPTVVSLSPENGATGAAVGASLVITFDEDINLDNDAGTFELRRKSPDELVEAFDIFGSRVSGGNNNTAITIDPTDDLEEGVEYYFLIGNDVIIDNGDNAFAGLLTADDWSFTAEKLQQEIVFQNITDKTFGDDPFTAIAASNSGLSIDFSVVSGPITLSGNTVTITGAGEAAIATNQAGNETYDAAPEVTQTFTIFKSDQTITFDALSDRTFGDAVFTIDASASSGLTVDFSVVSGPVTLSGNELTIIGAGTAVIAANQAGSDNFNAALEVTQTFEVAKADQVVTMESIPDKLTTDSSFDVVASASSGLSLTYAIEGPATISGTTISLDGTAGTVTVTASQAGNDNYNAASASRSFVVSDPAKQDQSITFDGIDDKSFGDANFFLNASASSGLSVEFSVVSGPISIDGSEVTIDGAGNVVIAANQLGDEDFNPAPEVTQSFTVAKADQAIEVDEIPDKLTTDGPFDVFASVDSNLELTYSVEGPASISGTTITLNGTVGTVKVTVSQTGNENYNAASTQEVFEVIDEAKQDQTITFESIANKTFGDAPFSLVASASSGLTVAYSVVSGPVSISDNEATILGAGTAVIAANQAGNDEFNAAPEVQQMFEIAKADQTIVIQEIADKLITDSPFDVMTTVDSGLELTYAVEGPAEISGTTITLAGTPGTVTVTVTQAGNENYELATASETFEVTEVVKLDQTITFATIVDKVFGDDPFALSASTTSGLAVEFSLVSGPVSIVGAEVTILGAGTVVIAANQVGNDQFNAAEEVQQTFEIAKADQAITLESIDDKFTTDAPFEVTATVDTDLELTYIVTGPASISGNTITLEGTIGEVTVTVEQSGTENYNSASMTTTFMVLEAPLSVASEIQVSIFPNPTSDFFMVESDKEVEINLYDLDGKHWKNAVIRNGKIDVSDLANGTYLLQVKSENRTTVKRLIKAN